VLKCVIYIYIETQWATIKLIFHQLGSNVMFWNLGSKYKTSADVLRNVFYWNGL